MSFFQRLRNALSRFMYGRNGADQLGLCIIWVAILLDVISMLTKNTAVSGVVGMITTVLVLWALFPESGKAPGGERRLFAEGLVAHQAPVQQRTAAADGQGAQVLHLPQLQDRVPRAGREGEDRHYLPQMRPGDTRKKLISYYRKTSAPTFVGALVFRLAEFTPAGVYVAKNTFRPASAKGAQSGRKPDWQKSRKTFCQ